MPGQWHLTVHSSRGSHTKSTISFRTLLLCIRSSINSVINDIIPPKISKSTKTRAKNVHPFFRTHLTDTVLHLLCVAPPGTSRWFWGKGAWDLQNTVLKLKSLRKLKVCINMFDYLNAMMIISYNQRILFSCKIPTLLLSERWCHSIKGVVLWRPFCDAK